MAFDSHDQQQLDWLKLSSEKYGKWFVVSVFFVIVLFLGYKGYQYYQRQQLENAAALYEKIVQQIISADLAKVKPLIDEIKASYPKAAYTSRAVLQTARLAFDKQDIEYTRSQLKWVIEHSAEPAVEALARLRLASVLLDQKNYKAALAELNQKHESAFDVLFLDLKGEVYAASGNVSAARDAWKTALAKLQGDKLVRQMLEAKLDSLGS